jgi:phosphatidate cytidylyltransferase
MPLNTQTLKTRSLTALVFVAVMLVGLLWSFWSFLILFTVVHFGCWVEYIKLMKKIYGNKFLLYSLFGLFYITLPIILLMWLRSDNRGYLDRGQGFLDLGFIIPCAIIFSIWINDTMAYIVGSLIGKTPLSKISPKKTWEGTIGGIVLCMVFIGFLSQTISFGKFLELNEWLAIAALCAIFGTLGDLFESKLKRLAGVKDSGRIMPGHGGFLDRFDSLLFAAPVVWVYVKLFM